MLRIGCVILVWPYRYFIQYSVHVFNQWLGVTSRFLINDSGLLILSILHPNLHQDTCSTVCQNQLIVFAPNEVSAQPGYLSCLILVFAVHSMDK